MYAKSLKSNIIINLVLLLLFAMIFIDFILLTIFQRQLIHHKIKETTSIIDIIANSFAHQIANSSIVELNQKLLYLINENDVLCISVVEPTSKDVFFNGSECPGKGKLNLLARQSMQSGKQVVTYQGTTWGVFWKQNRYAVISSPIIQNQKTVAGISMLVSLQSVFDKLIRIQKVTLFFILANTIILSAIGSFLLSKITIKPIYRLVKKAEEFKISGDFYTFPEDDKEEHEFGKLSKSLSRMFKKITADQEKLKITVTSLEKANSELKKAQRDMIRAEKLASVGRLSAGLAHEIGNPIGIILGYLELLKQNSSMTDEYKEYIQRAQSEIQRINKIIQQLLDLSRSNPSETTVFSVHELIVDISHSFSAQPFMSDIEIDLQLISKYDMVKADSDQIRQVFINLFINASDAISTHKTGNKGTILIRTEPTDLPESEFNGAQPALLIQFTDNGIGIQKQDLNNIFDPFFTTKEPGKGTGLGLSVSYIIVQSYGGSMKVSSDYGQGTTISMILPIARKDIQT